MHSTFMRHSGEGRNPDGLSVRSSGVIRLILAALVVACLPNPVLAASPTIEQPVAVLRALDKMTARVEELEVPITQPLKFGNIFITVRTCRVTPPEETPEAAAYLEVSEFKPGEKDIPVFQGWMFASSPALSAMEHPVYDLWVTGCKTTPAPASAIPATPAK